MNQQYLLKRSLVQILLCMCWCVQPVLISEDDVQKQEQKVHDARRRLQQAMKQFHSVDVVAAHEQT